MNTGTVKMGNGLITPGGSTTINGTVSQVGRKTKIEPGCEIVVPTKKERTPFDWSHLATIGSSMASLATLILAITKL